MEFDSVISQRKSTRSFNTKKPSWKLVLKAIDSTLNLPFAGNMNNLKFIIIEDKKTIDKLSEITDQPWIAKSQLLVTVTSDERHLENKYGERGRIYNKQQAGAAISTFLHKLTDFGLDSCWVGAYEDKLVRDLLKIPPYYLVEAIIPIGFENKKDKTQKPKKQELENALRWEDFTQNRKPTPFKEPDFKER